MSYVTAFEITHDSSLWWWPWVFGTLIFALLGAIILLLTRNLFFITKIIRFVAFLFACLWLAVVAHILLVRRHYAQAYRNGKYAVIEGPVEHYSWKGKRECFTVRVVEFCRATGNPEQLGWPIGLIRDGLPVGVAYSEMQGYPKILRLDIAHNPR